MSLIPATASTGLDTSAAKTDREKLSATAKQFEALFMRQMLAAARKTSFSDETDVFGSQAMSTFRQMQDEHFADIAAQTGSLGMAAIIEAQMARYLPDGDGKGTSPALAATPASQQAKAQTA